jgi:hypothetical protein
MDSGTPHGQEGDESNEDNQSRRRILRAAFYCGCACIILTALLVALVTASAPPPDDARIAIIDSSGTRLPSDDTIKALRQTCARERIEASSWQWSIFDPSEIALRCMVRNRDTGLLSTILWRFSDFGSDQAGHSRVLLTGIETNGLSQDAYTAAYFLVAVLHAR